MAEGRAGSLFRILTGAVDAGGMGQSVARARSFLDSLDPEVAAKLLAAAEAGDNSALLKAMSKQQWGLSPARATPRVEVSSGGRSPMSLGDRLATEPKIRAGVEDAGMATEGLSQAELLDAYAQAFKKNGGQRGRPLTPEDSIRESRAALAKPADQVAAEDIADQFSQSTGLIPYGSRGPGVAVGGPSGPGRPLGPSTALVPAEPRGLTVTNASAPDALEAADSVIDDVASVYPREPLPAENVFAPEISQRPRLEYQGPRGPGVPVGGVARERPTGLIVPKKKAGVPGWVPAAAAGGAGLGGVAYLLSPGDDAEAITEIGNPADLDEKQATAPYVPFDEEVLMGMSEKDLGQPIALSEPPPKTWRDMTDEEMLAPLVPTSKGGLGAAGGGVARNPDGAREYGERYYDAAHGWVGDRDTARMAARAASVQAGPAAPVTTAMVDGYEVPVHLDSTGTAMQAPNGGYYYRLGDLKAAQEAEAEARRIANMRDWTDSDIAKYGHYSIRDNAKIGDGPGMLTQEQYDARMARQRAEKNSQNTQRSKELRSQRLHAKAGIPEKATEDMSEEAVLRMLGRNRESAEASAARNLLRERNMLAGGSHRINSGNISTFTGMALLNPAVRGQMPEQQIRQLRYALPGGREAAAVDAQNNEQLAALGLRVATGQGFQQLPPEAAALQVEGMRQKVAEGKSVLQRAQDAAAAGKLNDESIAAHANALVNQYYSAPFLGANTTPFTDNEVDLAAQKLADDLDIDFDDAKAIMRRIQGERSGRAHWIAGSRPPA